eukprot:6244374-Heterocapsa_arctica.AAC.1
MHASLGERRRSRPAGLSTARRAGARRRDTVRTARTEPLLRSRSVKQHRGFVYGEIGRQRAQRPIWIRHAAPRVSVHVVQTHTLCKRARRASAHLV